MQGNHAFTGVQTLRFVAAMLVVLTHATGMVSQRILHMEGDHFWVPGMAGVDLFFVISGFVMAVSSRSLIGRPSAWKTFIIRRIIRIVPLYWIATTLKVGLVLALPALALNTPISTWAVIASYLFIPTFDNTGNFIFPVLKVGWTLNYEMLFYILFALALFLRQPAVWFTGFAFILFTLINLSAGPDLPYAYSFLNPIMLEFVMGMLVAEFCKRGYTINPVIGAVAVIISFAIMFSADDLSMWWRWAYWGLPAMVIVTVVTLLEPLLRNYIPKILTTLGDSSYSLYLFHTFTVPLLGTVFIKLHLADPVIAVIASMVISPIIGLIIYKILELPMTEGLKRRFQTRSSA